jgi:adenine-specific DNA-methyltransferase
VYCAKGGCRNNLGDWDVREVPAETDERNAAFYSAKDRVMAREANVGLMLWDGKSVGTLMNVLRLLGLGKKAVVYTVPEKMFTDFHSVDEWDGFMAERQNSVREKLRQRASLEPGVGRRGNKQASLFDH